MTQHRNHLNQALGLPVKDWKGAKAPTHTPIQGEFCSLEPLDPKMHLDSLWEAQKLDTEGRSWTYLSYGPHADKESYRHLLQEQASSDEPLFFAIVNKPDGRAVGVVSYLRIFPERGSIEIGHVYFSPPLQRTRSATEALYLLSEHAFDKLGYRRLEWKCDSLNSPSRRAAERLGFTFEGIFRQATVYKNRNRDTAWYSMLDSEWPPVKRAFKRWLSPENFKSDGQQKARLSEFMELESEGAEEQRP